MMEHDPDSSRRHRRLTVSIVNFFTSNYIATCLGELLESPVASIQILDNSVDADEWDRLAELAKRDPRIEIVRSDGNVGFGKGHNQLADRIVGHGDDLMWILNPDTHIATGCVESLISKFDQVDAPTVMSPLLLQGGATAPTVWFAGGTLDRVRGVVAHDGYGRPVDETDAGLVSTDFMCGAAMMMTLDTWRASGGFRSDLFLYWEDVEFSARCSDRGIALVVDRDARMWHDEGGSQQQTEVHSAIYYRYMNRNRIRIASEWTPLAGILFGGGARRTSGLALEPLRFGGVKSWREFRSGVRGLIEGILAALVPRLGRPRFGPAFERTTLIVHAPTPSGGHPEYVFKELSGLRSADSQFDIVWPRRSDLEDKFESRYFSQPTVIPTQLPRTGLSKVQWLRQRLQPSRRHDVAFCQWLLRQRGADVVLIEEVQRFTLFAVIAACKFVGARSFVHLHNIRRHDYSGSVLDRLDEYLTGRALQWSDGVIVHSAANALSLQRNFGSNIDVSVVPHGIRAAVTVAGQAPATPQFLFFGEIRSNKGVADLLAAFEKVTDTSTLVIAGRAEPEMRKILESQIAQGGPVRWIDGFVDASDVAGLMVDATAVVLPYTEFDAQSGVLHLAIEYGVPVVVTDVGALGETVRDLDIGLVVEPRNASNLADAMIEIADPELNGTFRRRAIAAQNGLSWESVGGLLAGVLSRR